MRRLRRGRITALVRRSAAAGWQMSAVKILMTAGAPPLAAFRDQAYRQTRQVAQLQEMLRARDSKVINLLDMVSRQDQELVDLRAQVDRSRVRDRIELSRSNLSMLAAGLEHFFQDNGQYPARLAELVPGELKPLPPERGQNPTHGDRPTSMPHS